MTLQQGSVLNLAFLLSPLREKHSLAIFVCAKKKKNADIWHCDRKGLKSTTHYVTGLKSVPENTMHTESASHMNGAVFRVFTLGGI